MEDDIRGQREEDSLKTEQALLDDQVWTSSRSTQSWIHHDDLDHVSGSVPCWNVSWFLVRKFLELKVPGTLDRKAALVLLRYRLGVETSLMEKSSRSFFFFFK